MIRPVLYLVHGLVLVLGQNLVVHLDLEHVVAMSARNCVSSLIHAVHLYMQKTEVYSFSTKQFANQVNLVLTELGGMCFLPGRLNFTDGSKVWSEIYMYHSDKSKCCLT